MRWEMMSIHCDASHGMHKDNYQERLDKVLADDWEPFAVTPVDGYNPGRIFFKRPAKEPMEEMTPEDFTQVFCEHQWETISRSEEFPYLANKWCAKCGLTVQGTQLLP